MAAITQWKGLSLGVSHVRHVWAVEGPKEPSIWTCCCRLLEVAQKMGRQPSEPLAIWTELYWEERSWVVEAGVPGYPEAALPARWVGV